MSTVTTSASNEARYKFVVSSAEEAVRVLRERLGEHARVVSVRQVEGAGLAKFLRAPKLEVIAEVVDGDAAQVFDVPGGEESGSDAHDETQDVVASARERASAATPPADT